MTLLCFLNYKSCGISQFGRQKQIICFIVYYYKTTKILKRQLCTHMAPGACCTPIIPLHICIFSDMSHVNATQFVLTTKNNTGCDAFGFIDPFECFEIIQLPKILQIIQKKKLQYLVCLKYNTKRNMSHWIRLIRMANQWNSWINKRLLGGLSMHIAPDAIFQLIVSRDQFRTVSLVIWTRFD